MKRLKTLLFLSLIIVGISAAPAMADETQIEGATQTPVTVSPPDCEFQITFPGEPYTTQRCSVEEPNKCNNLTSYTNVFGLDATVNFTFSCYKADEDMFARYSGDVMNAVLAALVSDQNLDKHQSGFQEDKDVKQAVILGAGTTGNSDKLYMAQLWIGHHSVMTLEGEIIGDAYEPADDMFKSVIDSLKRKEDPTAAKESAKDDDPAKGEEDDKSKSKLIRPADKPAKPNE